MLITCKHGKWLFPLGHYIYLSLDSLTSESVIMSHASAGYVCGYSFHYQLFGDAELTLHTSSGEPVWSSGRGDVSEWTAISSSSVQFITGSLDDGLQFVLVSYDTQAQVALDNIKLDFCLPCDFDSLEVEGKHTWQVHGMHISQVVMTSTSFHFFAENFYLTYQNYSQIYLRTSQTLSVEVIKQ